jgi:catechol 2,3-dioxygenase-like lactoylglutathione lyase family enzyme
MDMPRIGNITFDCADPTRLSDFWSDVMHYERSELPEEMRTALLAAGVPEASLGDRGVAWGGPGTQRFFFQRVPEPKVVKNRVHLDLSLGEGRPSTREEVDAEVERVVALGATVLGRYDSSWGPYPEYHYTLADPEGNEFCIQ